MKEIPSLFASVAGFESGNEIHKEEGQCVNVEANSTKNEDVRFHNYGFERQVVEFSGCLYKWSEIHKK